MEKRKGLQNMTKERERRVMIHNQTNEIIKRVGGYNFLMRWRKYPA
jgi:hypothetical protein